MKKKANELSKGEKEKAVELVKEYLDREFELDTGRLQVALFVDYLEEKLAPYFYNNGIRDAITYMEEKTEDMVLLIQDAAD